MTEQEDRRLCQRCLSGNRVAQFELYELYRKAAYGICVRYASDRQMAKDYLQEGFLRVFKDLEQYDHSKGPLWPWMRKVFVNTCLQFLRKKQILRYEHLGENDLPVIPEVPTSGYEFSTNELLGYLQKLPEGYRTVFNLHVLEGYTHPEIASVLDISVNTSKSQLSKAKRYLRKFLLDVMEARNGSKLERTV